MYEYAIIHENPQPDTGRYGAEFAICQEMGWSWRELMEAPADFVEEIGERMGYRAKWQAQRRKFDQEKVG